MEISIIVPVYNAMPFLVECIQSIQNQSFQNWELILIDDGSSDESGSYCDMIAAQDKRIKVHHQQNTGLVMARQTGIKLATGDYILFVDADDEIECEQLEQLYYKIKEVAADIILFGLVEENKIETIVRKNCFQEGLYNRDRIVNEIIPEMITGDNFFEFHILPNLVCKCIRREWLLSCKYEVSPQVTYGEDADFTYQILPQANTVYILDLCSYHYKKRENSMVGLSIAPERIDALESDLYRSLSWVDKNQDLLEQYKKYILFARLVKCPYTVLDIKRVLGTRVALYGAGGFGCSIKNELQERCAIWVDQNYEKYINVSSAEELLARQNEFDEVFIAILNETVCKKVIEKYKSAGLDKKFYYISCADEGLKIDFTV